jgi:hypothetical protein
VVVLGSISHAACLPIRPTVPPPVRIVEPVCCPCPYGGDKPPVNPFAFGALPFWKFLERENVIARLAEAKATSAACSPWVGRSQLESAYGLGQSKNRLDVQG